MPTRLYRITENGVEFPKDYYSRVLNNTKAKPRIRKKAHDNIETINGISGSMQLRRAANDQLSFSEWNRSRNQHVTRRNIGAIGRRSHCAKPLKTAFRDYTEYAKYAVAAAAWHTTD